MIPDEGRRPLPRKVLLVNPNFMKPVVTPVAIDYLAQTLEEKGFVLS
jgi:hypothetical protein